LSSGSPSECTGTVVSNTLGPLHYSSVYAGYLNQEFYVHKFREKKIHIRRWLLQSVKILSSCLIITIMTSIQPVRVNLYIISKLA
jgi:hypothetical protein